MTSSFSGPTRQPWIAVYLRSIPQVSKWAAAVGVATFLFTLVLRSRYTASVSFIAAEDQSASLPSGGIAAIASQFGIGATPGSESPQFYAALLSERSILDPVIQDTFATSAGQRTALIDVLDAGGREQAEKLELAAKKLGERASTTVDAQTNIVTLTVELPDPLIAATVANLLIARLDTFNQVSRRTEARARRIFVESQLTDAKHDLGAAEDSLRRFYLRNRRIMDSPTLLFEEARLKRNVDLQDNLFESLNQQYQQARIDEVRDTPVLTVLQPALIPTKRSWPRRGVSAVFGAVTMAVLMLGWVTWAELAQRNPVAAATWNATREVWESARNWTKKPKTARDSSMRHG